MGDAPTPAPTKAVPLSLLSSETIPVPWFIPSGFSLPHIDAKVGDTLVFNWRGFHNVYKHPSGSCGTIGRIEVGTLPGASYTITRADAKIGEIVFACDVGLHCENGQTVTVNVAPLEELPEDEPELPIVVSPSQSPSVTPSISTESPTPPTNNALISSKTINVDWFIPGGFNLPAVEFNAGDTIVFNWNGFHNVYIHPWGGCSTVGRRLVGNQSGVSYAFTDEDVERGRVIFACDVGSHCENGQMVIAKAASNAN